MLMSPTAGGMNRHNCIVFPSDFSSMESYKLLVALFFHMTFEALSELF
jgi:hypothetical protein